MSPLRVTQLQGDPYAMGRAHGEAHREQIGEITEDRLRLCYDGFWAGDATRETVPDLGGLAEACWAAQRDYDEATTAEIEGLAHATGIPARDLLIAGGFTDFVDCVRAEAVASLAGDRPANGADDRAEAGGCTAVLVAGSETLDGRPYLAQTWDMHASATPYVILLEIRPDDPGTPASMVFTLTGCVGMIGINDAGLCVGINNLMTNDGRPGVMWTSVVRRLLRERTATAAMEHLKAVPLAGAHHYLLLDAQGVGCSVEATPTRCVSRPLGPDQPTLSHTNHCLSPETKAIERPKQDVPLDSTHRRLKAADAWLGEHRGGIDRESLWSLLRQRDPDPGLAGICHGPLPGYPTETAGAVVMSPVDRRLDALWGQPDRSDYTTWAL